MATFLTGATGFIGRYLAAAMLEAGEDLVALVRCRNAEEGLERLSKGLAFAGYLGLSNLSSRVRICPGDLATPGLGLQPEDRDRVRSTCERFLHCGASIRFDMRLEEARAVNVAGTAAVLDLARERLRLHGVERLDILSTAYVAGSQTAVVPEIETDGSAGHKNTYERSKFEAEQLVWRARGELPVCIFRPSIVVGESTTGKTSSFSTIYLPIRLYARRLWRTLPANPECMLDLVPVDFVRDSILEIRRDPASVGRCFHLAAGPDGVITIGELIQIVERFFPRSRPVRFVSPERWMRYVQPVLQLIRFGRFAKVAATIGALLPYCISNPCFETTNTRKALAESGLEIPDVRTYLEELLEYFLSAESRRWN